MEQQGAVNAGKKFLELQDLSAYKKALELANTAWEIVNNWNFFEKDTIGKQFVRSVDSIGANIAEGFGRYTKKEKIQFYRYSYGSMSESVHWCTLAHNRHLLSAEQNEKIMKGLQQLPRDLHILIAYTNAKLTI